MVLNPIEFIGKSAHGGSKKIIVRSSTISHQLDERSNIQSHLIFSTIQRGKGWKSGKPYICPSAIDCVVNSVAIVGWEWIVILAILAVIMIWGPDKIPKLARALGQARKEFEKAQKEFTNPAPEPEPASTAEPKTASDDYLIQTAKSLGIETAGKTREQISKEILERARTTQPQTTTPPQSGQQQ